MPNTPNHQLPYPDDEEWLNQGAYSIEQLATRLDTIMDTDTGLVVVARTSWNAPLGTSPVALDFPGAQLALSGFTRAGGTFTRTGPTRLFMVEAEVEVEAGASGGTTSASSTVEVRANGAAFAGSHDNVTLTVPELQVRRFTHRVSTIGRFGNGDTLDVTAVSSPAGTIGVCGLRIHPVGPAE